MLPKPILLSRAQIDAQAWDNHIHHSRQCVIYALSWYLDIVCEQWQALVWPSAADFSIVMPLPIRRKWGIHVPYQPQFCQYLGIFSKYELTGEQCQAFMRALLDRHQYVSSYSFNPENYDLMRPVLGHLTDLHVEIFKTHWLDLRRSYDKVYEGYAKDRKVNLRKSAVFGWQIVESDDFKPLIKLFIENHAFKIGRVGAETYRTLEALGKRCIDQGCGNLLYACAGGVHAGFLLVRYGERVIYLFNAADGLGRKGNARAFMLDAYFLENSSGRLVFDFESPQKPSVAGYYAASGSATMSFFHITRNALPFPFRQLQNVRKRLIIKTRRYLSSSLYTTLSPSPKTRF
ncbi:MAG: GNAT family N-acetyltransferase [Dyadobacter fermentans]